MWVVYLCSVGLFCEKWFMTGYYFAGILLCIFVRWTDLLIFFFLNFLFVRLDSDWHPNLHMVIYHYSVHENKMYFLFLQRQQGWTISWKSRQSIWWMMRSCCPTFCWTVTGRSSWTKAAQSHPRTLCFSLQTHITGCNKCVMTYERMHHELYFLLVCPWHCKQIQNICS